MGFDFFFTHLENSLKNVHENPTIGIYFYTNLKGTILWQQNGLS